jgi:hypothetical protein
MLRKTASQIPANIESVNTNEPYSLAIAAAVRIKTTTGSPLISLLLQDNSPTEQLSINTKGARIRQ